MARRVTRAYLYIFVGPLSEQLNFVGVRHRALLLIISARIYHYWLSSLFTLFSSSLSFLLSSLSFSLFTLLLSFHSFLSSSRKGGGGANVIEWNINDDLRLLVSNIYLKYSLSNFTWRNYISYETLFEPVFFKERELLSSSSEEQEPRWSWQVQCQKRDGLRVLINQSIFG